jgi:hypothetical protein
MLIIKPDSADIFEYPGVLSEDDSILIRFTYRPPIWQASIAYIEKKNVVIPITFNGFQYLCTSGGISKSTEPTWLTVSKGTTEDLGVTWTAQPYDYMLQPGQDISASSWTAINATLLTDSFTDDYAEVQIDTITHGSSTVTLINTVTFGITNQTIKRAIIINVEAVR